jgi:hypothetical protein
MEEDQEPDVQVAEPMAGPDCHKPVEQHLRDAEAENSMKMENVTKKGPVCLTS